MFLNKTKSESYLWIEQAVCRVSRTSSLPFLSFGLDFCQNNKNRPVINESQKEESGTLRKQDPALGSSSPSMCSVVTRPSATMNAIFCKVERDKTVRNVSYLYTDTVRICFYLSVGSCYSCHGEYRVERIPLGLPLLYWACVMGRAPDWASQPASLENPESCQGSGAGLLSPRSY